MTILWRQLDIYWRDLRVTLVYPFTEKQLLNTSIHPFSVPTYLYRTVGKLAPILRRDGVPLWTGGQSITGQHIDTQDKQPCTLMPNGILETN